MKHIGAREAERDGALPHTDRTEVACLSGEFRSSPRSMVERQPQLTERGGVRSRWRLWRIAELHHQSVGGGFGLSDLDPTQTAAARRVSRSCESRGRAM